MRTITTLFAVATLIGPLALTVKGQDLLPLEQLLKRTPDQVEPSYVFVRCAAYYKSMVDYIGTNNLPDDVVTSTHKAASLNAFAATKIRASNRGGSPNDYVNEVMNDVKLIVGIYDARMRENYARSGQAFARDELINGDAAVCHEFTETIAGK
jgi:hypothetical protein